MEDLKIRVNSEAESEEAQCLFFELGYRWLGCHGSSYFKINDNFKYITAYMRGMSLAQGTNGDAKKEITMLQLRDMVVLKRNDVGDATHKGNITDNAYYVSSDEEVYRLESSAWCFSTVIVADLKPIKKPMKEYLRKNSNGTYSYIGTVRPEHVSDFMIEIPSGMNIYWKEDGDYWFTTQVMGYRGAKIIWQRHAHPEELPFIDDEPKYDPEDIGIAKDYDLDELAKEYKLRDRYDGETDEDYRYALEHYIDLEHYIAKETLNDKVASAEVARQEFITPFDTQINGDHYKLLPIQPMKFALANGLDYAQGNVIKYVIRHASKNGKDDLLKAIHNIELMIEHYYG